MHHLLRPRLTLLIRAVRRGSTWSLIVALCLLPRAASATTTVTFDEALELARSWNRGFQRALAARETEDAKIGGTAQQLTLTVVPGYRFAPEQERGLEGEVALAQSWNLARLGHVRRQAASAERSVLSAQARAEALAARLEAARRWLDLYTLESLDSLAQAQLEIASEMEAFVRRGAEAGLRTSVDLVRTRTFRAEMAQQRLDAHGALYYGALALSAVLGRKPDALLRTAGPLPEPRIPDEQDLARFVERAQELPEPLALRLSSLAARARQAEESAAYGSILSLGALVAREPPSAYSAFGTVSLAWSPFDRGARGRSLQREQAVLFEAEYERAQIRAEADLRHAVHEHKHAREALELVEQDWLVAARETVERVERALQVGEATMYELLDARRRLVDVESLWVRARAERTWADVRLWLLLSEITREEPPR